MLCVPVTASAQAFIGDPNSLSASFGYAYAPSGKVIFSSTEDDSPLDDEMPGVSLLVHQLTLGAQYNTPAPGLAVEAILPLVGVKLKEGSFVHGPIPGEYDDGDSHFTLTDLRAGLRYQIKPIEEYIGLSFLAAGSIPVRDYPTNGFANPGSHLKALILGAALGRTFDPVIPNLFFQGSFEYAIKEKVDDTPATEEFSRNTSDMSFVLGYFLPAGLYIDAAADLHYTLDGVTYTTLPLYTMDVLIAHDRLLDEDSAHVGGDLGYQVTDEFSIVATTRFFVWGKNTRNHNIFGLSLEYTLF